MNSMIRQHHLRINDVKAYLRAFERNKPLSPDEWASQESALYEPGHLIFCLEAVAAPAGLSSFSKRGEEQGETYRVKNMFVVISKDDGKPVAVNVSASAYEFRVLDSFLLEQAMKAILDGRDFNYLAARPVQKLDNDGIKALYKLGSEYAKGGSRRALIADSSTLAEPATALLGQMGAKIGAAVGKQLLDIGSVCHMIFTPEGRQEDKNKTLLKSCFVPMRGDEELVGLTKSEMSEEQPRYAVDPLAGVAHLEEKYSSQPGSIDLSHLAPEPVPQLNYETPMQAFPEKAGEPSSSFGDFGMGQISALAPQNPPDAPPLGQPAAENPADSSPPPQTYTPQSGAMGQMPAGGSGGSSYTNLPPSGSQPPAGGSGSSYTNLPPSGSQPPAGGSGASYTNLPPAGGPGGSYTNLSGLGGQPPAQAALAASGNGQGHAVAPEWYVMSHQGAPAARPPAQTQSEMIQPPPSAQEETAAPEAPPAAATEPQAASGLKEDYSQQFLNDWQEGKTGTAAEDAAEKEFEKEKLLKAEREKGKEQRLREYFGEEHFQKYVKGEIPEPEIDQINAWQLDPSQYRSEPA